MVERLPKLLPARSKRMCELGLELKRELLTLLGPNGVMIFPSYATPAPRHRKALLPPIHWAYAAILNVLEVPVTQVPLGLNPHGLPLGVQVVGSHGADAVTIAVAEELERGFGGWVPPPRWS